LFKTKNCPELRCFRDIAYWWKFLTNPDKKIFVNFSPPDQPKELERLTPYSAQLNFSTFDENTGGYEVGSLGGSLHCRPDPNQVSPITGKVIPTENLYQLL
jgi:hypothetical protein